MIKRLNEYLLNSMKVAILGFCWFMLFQIPWESLPNAPLGGKVICAIMVWAVWSFMVLIVSGEIGKDKGVQSHEGRRKATSTFGKTNTQHTSQRTNIKEA